LFEGEYVTKYSVVDKQKENLFLNIIKPLDINILNDTSVYYDFNITNNILGQFN
jgi:hypothetical protein